ERRDGVVGAPAGTNRRQHEDDDIAIDLDATDHELDARVVSSQRHDGASHTGERSFNNHATVTTDRLRSTSRFDNTVSESANLDMPRRGARSTTLPTHGTGRSAGVW